MPQISRTEQRPIHPDDRVSIPGMELPSIRKIYANSVGALGRIMIQVRGGIGDYICAEPAIRYAIKNLKQEIHIATYHSEIYRHLNFASVHDFSSSSKMPDWATYLNFHTLSTGDDITAEFFDHMHSHVVDHHTMLMWKIQLHPLDKAIQLMCDEAEIRLASELINPKNDIVIHPGQTWISRTMPKHWWDEVISLIKKAGRRPVIMGSSSVKDCGTVDVDSTDCLDLRDKMTIMQSVAVLKRAQVLLTNDSSPIHMAASGDAWIGFLSTVKPPHLLWHYRYGQMGWRMQNFSKDWLCNHIDRSPNMNQDRVRYDLADTEKWLCKPSDIVEWAVSKV